MVEDPRGKVLRSFRSPQNIVFSRLYENRGDPEKDFPDCKTGRLSAKIRSTDQEEFRKLHPFSHRRSDFRDFTFNVCSPVDARTVKRGLKGT